MIRKNDLSRSSWATLALVAGVGVILGLVATRSVKSVTAGFGPVGPPTGNPADCASPSVLAARDSLLADAVVGARDPFRAPAVPQASEGGTSTRKEGTVLAGTPVMRALLYDNVNPLVQIGIGSVTSGWLHTGDQFQGWTVVEINSSSVRIARNGESVVLPSS
jgi:hypothetical protein